MASAQVLPSSRKQELAEAGRRKLEQFRKQKAAERAKKASSNSHTQPVDSKIGQQRVAESNGAVTSMSNGTVRLSAENHYASSRETHQRSISEENHQASSSETHKRSSFSGDGYGSSSSNPSPGGGNKEKSQNNDAARSMGAIDFPGSIEMKDSSNMHSVDKQGSHNTDSGYTVRESDSVPKALPPFSGNNVLPSRSSETERFSYGGGLTSFNEDSLQSTTRMSGSIFEAVKTQQGSSQFRGGEEQKPSSSTSYLFNHSDTVSQPSEPSDSSLNIRSSSSIYSETNETSARRSRPSFLDSLNISKASEPQPAGNDGLGSASFQNILGKKDLDGPSSTKAASTFTNSFENSRSSLFPTTNGAIPSFNDFLRPQQNEDFAALEQHIEDLTQEKFSLQRALEASRALAESLASENSSLTDTYNQQRGTVNQLKDDMEKLQQQIQAHRVELESVRIEYENAQLECNAADERAKILASEVIGLEEKALRLRSNELKLERELENAQAELSSYKRKMSSLEKDRHDLQSTISALQEEKKFLQTMLRKASSTGKSVDLGQSLKSRKETSTSTQDLAMADGMLESLNQETNGSESSNTITTPGSDQLFPEGLSVRVPPDQLGMIENINTLIAELAMEKEELVQALSAELSQTSRLKELNKELSRKLEAQTQRLELITAQNMAVDNNMTPTKHPDSHLVLETVPMADEGDEVVERVLGWIMKLFPGGPSKRRTSKLI